MATTQYECESMQAAQRADRKSNYYNPLADAPAPPTREGGVIDRLRSSECLIGQLHEEIGMLEATLSALLASHPEQVSDKMAASKPGSTIASGLADQNRSLGIACERLRSLRMALDL